MVPRDSFFQLCMGDVAAVPSPLARQP